MFNHPTRYQCPFGYDADRCQCTSCHMERNRQSSLASLKQAKAKNFALSGSTMPIARRETPPEPPKKTTKDRLAAQRQANIEANDRAFAEVQARQVLQVSAEHMYWPPYNPLAPEGQKTIHVDYVTSMISIAVLSLEEAQELYTNLGGKDTISTVKTHSDLAKGASEAHATAKGLGGLGVKASIKVIHGKDWVIIRDFRRHQQTLMKGNKWGANNPKVIKTGLGLNDLKGAARFIRFNAWLEIGFSIGVNAVDFILRDEATLTELGINTAGDLTKGFASLAGAAFLTAALPATTTVLASGLVFAIASYLIGQGLDLLDTEAGYSEDITQAVESYFQ
ncbi:hypothetical protein KW459_17755 [Vibrio fluvialis]|nr:hypothetical protein [Vibrio fluvialis]MBY7941642.1 hypothetical protein [Vibrio fluvialis]